MDANELHLSTLTLCICVIMNILGQGAHLMFVTVPDYRQKMINLNRQFTYSAWWNCDSNLIIGVQILSLALMLGLAELIHWKPGLLDWIRWFFFLFGTVASLIGMRWSKYQQMIMGFIDINANITKVVVKGTPETVQELTEKASIALNTDVSVPPKDEPKP